MTYAPYTNDRRAINQGPVLGCFNNSEFDTFFEYAARTAFDGDWAADYPHIVFMSDGSVRYATIKKTVAYVVTDETAAGTPIAERWAIKRHRRY
tara:strand:- start:254 stop:535 length:282 start_codon:yes stop_codon:yes gene_type:complete